MKIFIFLTFYYFDILLINKIKIQLFILSFHISVKIYIFSTSIKYRNRKRCILRMLRIPKVFLAPSKSRFRLEITADVVFSTPGRFHPFWQMTTR